MTQITAPQSGKTAIAVTYIDHMGSDLSVVNAARVSFGKKSEWERGVYFAQDVLSERDTKLINYLAKHGHISPFGHAFVSFHVKAPIFVARQLVKHSYLRWNEVSRRYVDDEPEFYVPDQWRGRSADKKQGSDPDVVIDTAYYDRDDGYNTWDGDATSIAHEAYQKMIKLGVSPEQARMILPQSMMTEWYWTANLYSWSRMFISRTDPHTQKETQDVAHMIGDIIRPLFPVSWAELVSNS